MTSADIGKSLLWNRGFESHPFRHSRKELHPLSSSWKLDNLDSLNPHLTPFVQARVSPHAKRELHLRSMNPRIRFTKKQLEWYRSIKDFDRTPWWLPKIRGQKLDHAELFWRQENLSKSNRPSYAPEPVLWEILRRHPDLGPESSWKAQRKYLREAENELTQMK